MFQRSKVLATKWFYWITTATTNMQQEKKGPKQFCFYIISQAIITQFCGLFEHGVRVKCDYEIRRIRERRPIRENRPQLQFVGIKCNRNKPNKRKNIIKSKGKRFQRKHIPSSHAKRLFITRMFAQTHTQSPKFNWKITKNWIGFTGLIRQVYARFSVVFSIVNREFHYDNNIRMPKDF